MSGTSAASIRRLTFTPNDSEQHIKVTKDGSRILYYVPGPDISRIISESLTPPFTYAHTYTLDLETKKTAEIDDAFNLYPTIPLAWSVDENQVVLSEISTRKIYIVDPDRKSLQELKIPPDGVSELFEFSYSPDGKYIQYTVVNKYADPSFTSFLYGFEEKSSIQLGNTNANCLHSEWSPTGTQLLLLCDLSTNGIAPDYNVYVLDMTGSKSSYVKATSDFQGCNMPTWSPDGKQILMFCVKNSKRGFVLVNSDGSGYKEINLSGPNIPTHFWESVWTPDGRQVLYLGGDDLDFVNIYITNIDGSNNHAITAQKANYSQLSAFAIP